MNKGDQCWEFKPTWALMGWQDGKWTVLPKAVSLVVPTMQRIKKIRESETFCPWDGSRVPPAAFNRRETKCLECVLFDMHDRPLLSFSRTLLYYCNEWVESFYLYIYIYIRNIKVESSYYIVTLCTWHFPLYFHMHHKNMKMSVVLNGL